MITIGFVLAGILAAAIIAIGARFLVAPAVAATGYGVPAEGSGAYLSAKGVRDIASGLLVTVAMMHGDAHLLGALVLAATVIPVADAAIVLRHGGARSIAYGVHGGTAAVMLAAVALLLLG